MTLVRRVVIPCTRPPPAVIVPRGSSEGAAPGGSARRDAEQGGPSSSVAPSQPHVGAAGQERVPAASHLSEPSWGVRGRAHVDPQRGSLGGPRGISVESRMVRVVGEPRRSLHADPNSLAVGPAGHLKVCRHGVAPLP